MLNTVSVYCERLAPGLLGEPLNTLTNLAFLWVAAHAWRQAGAIREQRVLAALLAAIGLGSALFHVFATALTQLFDVLPIALFQLYYLYCYLRRVAAWAPSASGACLALYIVALGLAALAPPLFNGSLGYAPAALAMLALAFAHWRLRGRLDLLAAALLFLVSLAARSVDLVLCSGWPPGTHFIWHVLNAAMLYQLLAVYRRATGAAPLSR